MAASPPEPSPPTGKTSSAPWAVHAARLAAALGVLVAVRVLVILAWPPAAHSVDADAWQAVGAVLDQGRDPYSVTTFLNWPPAWMQLLFVLQRAHDATGVPFLRLVQGLLIAIESGGAVLLYALLVRLAPRARPLRWVLLGVSLNPVAVLQVCQHCNFDVLVGFWVLAFTAALATFGRSGRAADWLAACLFLGIAVLTKTVPLVLFPLLVAGLGTVARRDLLVGALLLLGPVVLGLSVIYVLGPAGVEANVLRYRSGAGWYGFTGLLAAAGWERAVGAWVASSAPAFALGLALLSAWILRRGNPPEPWLPVLGGLLLLAVPTLGPGYGSQYVAWYLPLLVLADACRPGRWRVAVRVLYGVAVATYLVEYALFPSHGMFLVHWGAGGEIRELSSRFAQAWPQTLLRLPLFLADLGVLWVGVQELMCGWRRAARDPAEA